MKRSLVVILSVLGLGGLGACDKPSADDCRQAIENMQKWMGTSTGNRANDITGEIRLCRGGSTKDAVACAAKATSLDELKTCKFMGSAKPATDPAKPATDPAKPATGSAKP